ncbi:MAG: carboxypeptidase-like regulatory domain-containing protein, partial [Gammaproteobacteria bacterium]|nr:carboxypeptidase-like regulatory domain-containing protein [Gammaproteobacteria bacterium]
MACAKPIAVLPFVLCSGLVDACDTFTISGRVSDQGFDRDTWIGVFQDPLADPAEPVASAWVDTEFELEVPCAESMTLLAMRKGAVPLTRRISGPPPTAVHLRFTPGLSLTGSVHYDENIPIGGARVSVTRINEAEVRLPESLRTWRSSRDGAFVAGGLTPGTYRVAASADGHIPSELDVVVGEGGANRVDIRLPKAFFIAGRVVDTSGSAAVGAEIHGESSGMDRETPEKTTATTDSEGVFRLGPFRNRQRILVSARADLSRSDAAYFAAPIEDLVLTLHHAVEIRGSVSDALTGHLLHDFALKTYGPEVRSFRFRDAAGEFSAAVFWQTHYIVISAPGFVSWYAPVDFRSGGGDHDLGVVALEPERVATGRVLDAATGLPVQGASVRRWFDESDFRNRLELDPASRVAPAATTDEDGHFRLSGLPGGDVLLRANPQGFSPEAVVELPAGTNHIDIEVNLASTRIEGMLLTEEGMPAEGLVYVWEKDETGPLGKGVTGGGLWGTSVRAWERVDQGRFRVVLPERQEQYLVGARSEMGLVESQIVTVQNNEATEIHLVVERLGRVSGLLAGLVVGETARLRILDESGRALKPGIAAPSMANGPYSLQGVPEGRFTLRAKGNRRAITREFESDGHGETHVDLVFTGASRLSGVVAAGGNPIPGIKIETMPRNKSLTTGETRATSTRAYAIDGLDDGEYVVRVRGRSFGVEISGDTPYDIELGPLALSGVVTAEGPVLGALVTATPTSAEAGLGGSDRVDSRGSFRIDDLDEGEYTVRVSHPDHGEVSRTVYLGSAIENLDVYLPLSPADGHA